MRTAHQAFSSRCILDRLRTGSAYGRAAGILLPSPSFNCAQCLTAAESALQMVVFKRSQTFQPLPQFTCAALLNPGTCFDFELPQMLEFRETERLMNAFNAHARELGQATATTAAEAQPTPLPAAGEQRPAAAQQTAAAAQQQQQQPPSEAVTRQVVHPQGGSQADLQATVDWQAQLEAKFAAKRAQEKEDERLAAQMQVSACPPVDGESPFTRTQTSSHSRQPTHTAWVCIFLAFPPAAVLWIDCHACPCLLHLLHKLYCNLQSCN